MPEEEEQKKKPTTTYQPVPPPAPIGPSERLLRKIEEKGMKFGQRVLDAIESSGKQMQDVREQLGLPTTNFYRLLESSGPQTVDDLRRAYQVVRLAMQLDLPPDDLLRAYIGDREKMHSTKLPHGFPDEETRQSILDAGFPFGLRVLEVMEERGITPRMLVNITGMTFQTYYRMMRGDPELHWGQFNIDRIVRIARFLDIPPQELIALFYYEYTDMEGLESYIYMAQAYLDLPQEQRAMAVSMMTALRQVEYPGYPSESDADRKRWEQAHRYLHGKSAETDRLEDTPEGK